MFPLLFHFGIMTSFPQSIFSFYFLTELLRHGVDELQLPQWGDGMSSISPWDQRNSLYPEVFSLGDVSQLQQKWACPNTGCCSAWWKTLSDCLPPRHEFQCVWWPQSNILLFATCFVCYGFDTPAVHIDDWYDVSLKAWSLFKTSSTTMRMVQL